MKYLQGVLLCTLGLLACQPTLKTEKVVVTTESTTVDQKVTLAHEILAEGPAVVSGGIDAGMLRTQGKLTFKLNRASTAAANFLQADSTFAESHLKGVSYQAQWEIDDADGKSLPANAYKGGIAPERNAIDLVIPKGFAASFSEGNYLVKLRFYRGAALEENQVGQVIKRSFKIKRGFNLDDLNGVLLAAKAKKKGAMVSQNVTASLSYDGLKLRATLQAKALGAVGDEVIFSDFSINKKTIYTLRFPTADLTGDEVHAATSWSNPNAASFMIAEDNNNQIKPGRGEFVLDDDNVKIPLKLVVELRPI